MLNNTYRSYELVNILSRIEADKGIVFNYADNQKLKESGFAVEGKTVNGFVDTNTGAVTLNVQSAKSWQSVVGHEITHVLEGTDAYEPLQKALYAYAESKGELTSRRGEVTELYKGMDADIDSELTAELIGDYLFTDKDFVTHLTSDRNLFQKVYDEIKYLYKVATGKEQKEIARVKKEFEKAWKELNVKPSESEQKNNTADKSGVRYSMGGKNAESANKSLLFEAERLESEGVDSEMIRKETGWFRSYDGMWRFEIDDSKSVLIEKPNLVKHTSEDGEVYFTGKLSDILEHDALYNAYPELRDINIVIQPTEFGVEGIYQPKSNYITLTIKLFERYTKEYKNFIETRNEEAKRIEQTEEYKEYNMWYEDEELGNLPPEIWLEEEKKARDQFYDSELGKRYYELKWGRKTNNNKFEFGWTKQAKVVLMHELQHAIQNIEGFATGASSNNKNYDHVAGEVEARDVGNRLEFDEAQRKEIRPDIDRTNVEFVENTKYWNNKNERKYEPETAGIIEQLKNSQNC